MAPIYAVITRKAGSTKYHSIKMGRGRRQSHWTTYRAARVHMMTRFVTISNERKVSVTEYGQTEWNAVQTHT